MLVCSNWKHWWKISVWQEERSQRCAHQADVRLAEQPDHVAGDHSPLHSNVAKAAGLSGTERPGVEDLFLGGFLDELKLLGEQFYSLKRLFTV